MGKKNKSSQFPKGTAPKQTVEQNFSHGVQQSIVNFSVNNQRIQPEQISLDAHQHIQNYLKDAKKTNLDKEDLTAILRLSQHLRVFGLLSAVGYINQSNEQKGKIRERTVPVWKSLLEQLLEVEPPITTKNLMEKVVIMSKESPRQYMATWRKSLTLTNHWNFWGRAYAE